MKLITPFDLVARFPQGRSLAIVGNAPSLRGAGQGGWIDSFDVVARFNGCALREFEADVGARTDILVCNPYPDTFHRPPADGMDCGLILVINPQTRRGDKAVFEDWAGERDVLFTYTPDVYGWEGLGHAAGLTTGLYAVSLLRRVLAPSRLAITGFTLFQEDTAGHYWSETTPSGTARHDLRRDAELLIELVNAFGPGVVVTSDIAWLSRRIERPLSEAVEVLALPDPSWGSGRVER